MGQVISDTVNCSSYINARVVVDYSGSWATANIQYYHTYGGYCGYTGSFSYGAGSSSASGSWSGACVSTSWETKMQIGFSISEGGGTYNIWCSGYSYNDFSVNVYIPSQPSAPTGLGCNSISRGIENFSANVYISGWGRGSGSRYRELQCWTQGMVSPRRYQAAYGDATSGTITVSNSSSGSLNIRGNTMYTLGLYATNGEVSTGSQRVGDYTTRAYAPTLSVSSVGERDAVISYSTLADGGKYTKYIQYSADGTNWITGATVSTGSATTGTFTINGLTDGTSYTYQTRVHTESGDTAGNSITFTTLRKRFYGSVNNESKRIVKLYGSVYQNTESSTDTLVNATAFNGETMHTWIKNNCPKVYARINDIRKIKVVNTSAGYYSANVIVIDSSNNEYLMASLVTSNSYLLSMGITFKSQGELVSGTDIFNYRSYYVTKKVKKLYASYNNITKRIYTD